MDRWRDGQMEGQTDPQTDGQTDGETDESDFIGRCLTNVEHPTSECANTKCISWLHN